MKIRKFIDNFFAVLGVVIVLWIAASFVDVTIHNSPFDENSQQFHKWNIVVLLDDFWRDYKLERK